MVSQKQIIMTANNTQVNKEKILSVFHAQKANSLAIGKTTARERIRKLQKLHDLVMKYRPEIREAMRLSREGAKAAEVPSEEGSQQAQDERAEEETFEAPAGLNLAPRALPPKVDLHKSDSSSSDKAK